MAHRIPTVYQRAVTGGDPFPGVNQLTVEQVASWLNCSRSFVYKLIDEKQLPALRIGNRKGMRIAKASVSEYLAKRARSGSRSD